MYNYFLSGLEIILTVQGFFLVFTGATIGLIIGAIPGLGPDIAIAVLIPFTFGMDPNLALIFLLSIYTGGMAGGAVSSILINAPGTSAAAATTLDGYPMAKKGEAITALSIAMTSSAFGSFFGPLILLFLIIFISKFIMIFGTPEYFLLGLLGIVLIAAIGRESIFKGLIAGTFGMMLTSIGMAPMGFEMRYTFGFPALYNGIGVLPAILGLFAVAEMIKLAGEKRRGISERIDIIGSRIEGIKITFKNYYVLITSAVIGFIIGVIPGVGGTTACFIAYSSAKQSAKDSDSFGKGNPKGVIAAEAANNAVVGGAMVPTLMFGIPGSSTTAILLGGLLLHGLRPGINLFRGDGLILTYALILSIMLAGIFTFVIGNLSSPFLGKITLIRKEILIPLVLLFAHLGIYIIEFNFLHVLLVLFFGLLGFLLIKNEYPLIPFALAIVLGPLIEENFDRTIKMGGGSLIILFQRPVSIILIIIILYVLVTSFLKVKKKKGVLYH